MKIDLRSGFVKTMSYEAFMFPLEQVHFKLSDDNVAILNRWQFKDVTIIANLVSAKDFMLLAVAIDAIHKDWDVKITVHIPFMAYQQADRNFSKGESFSILTVVKMLNTLPVYKFVVYDPHSDVTPALLSMNKRCEVITNVKFVENTLNKIIGIDTGTYPFLPKNCTLQNTVVLSPDAGAYKKIGKLFKDLQINCEIETAVKYRNTKNGELEANIYRNDFEGKNVLIIDDICLGGRTFIELSKLLNERNVGKKWLAVSHGIFTNGMDELSKHFDGVYTTNSIQPMLKHDKLHYYLLGI